MRYELGKTYNFEVNKNFGEDEDFIRLIVPDYGEVHLPKLKFQREEPLPDSLKCRVKTFIYGRPVLSHFFAGYVNRLYPQATQGKKEYGFTVLELPAKPGDPYVLEDRYGIRYNLATDNAFLGEGQKVFCRFDKLTSNFYTLKLANGDLLPPFYSPCVFLDKIGVDKRRQRIVISLMDKFLPEAKADFDNGTPFWIVTALKAALPRMTEWFVSADFKRHRNIFCYLVELIRTAGLYLIENSRYLRNLDANRRRALQALLTETVDGLNPVTDALDIATRGREGAFIDNLRQKLGESGYLYHPAHQLSILMLILQKNPALVSHYLGGIFDTIMGWKLDTWTTEPFRSAFVEQFEIYIRQASHEIDLFPQADTAADADRIEKIVTAIALQMVISGNPDTNRYRLNRSLLYRYVSLQRAFKSDELLDKSFKTLMGAKFPLEFNYNNIRQPQQLMTCVTNSSAYSQEIEGVHRYMNGSVELTVSADGCSLRRTDERQSGRVIPNGMMDWLQPQVYLEDVQSLNGNQISSFDAHRRLWANIEKALFEKRLPNAPIEAEKQKVDVGDFVPIIISPEPIERGDNPRWMARIDHEDFITENGYINRNDIVGYKVDYTNLVRDRELMYNALVDEKGRPRHFVAMVKAIDPDGQLHFSLAEDVAQQLTENMNDYTTYHAVIAGVAKDGRYSAICETGYGVYLRRPAEGSYNVGDVVCCRMVDKHNPAEIVAEIEGKAEDGVVINKTRGLAKLLLSICLPDESEEEATEEYMIDADEAMSREDILQIVELIRYKVLSTTNLLGAFDYLHFARLLALIVDNEELAGRLKVHAELLRLHEFYAKNSRIDADELERYRSEVEGYPLLQLVFHRLEIVSWLGDAEHNADLWNTLATSRNHLETTLAQLVMSYNMLPNPKADDGVSESLKKQIAQTLGLNFEMNQLKSYGRENNFNEFKSSLVYPPKKKNEKPLPDPEKQQFVILKNIAAFMNTDGGTLYIGVSDKTHTEVGLFEDFEYYKRYRPSDGKIYHTIKNVDNLIVFLTNLVCNTWGKTVAGSVKIDIDPEASHDVIIVNVEARLDPVYLDGKIYRRINNNSMGVSGNDLDEFLDERKMLVLRQREELRAEAAKEAAEKDMVAMAANSQAAAALSDSAETYADAQEATAGIATSSWRPNVLHSYEEGYVEPAGYLYFDADGSFTRAEEDRWTECALPLVYTAREAEQGMLVMVFDNQKVLKVPMSEVVEKEADRPVSFYSDARPLYISIAMPGDALLTHLSDSKNNLSRRVTPLADYSSLHLTSSPEPIAQVPGVAAVVACETVAESALGAFEGSMAKDMSSRQMGYVLRASCGTEKANQILDDDRRNSRPQQA